MTERRRAVAWLILAGTAVRLVLAGTTGLGIDESYMVAAGRTLRLGYLDHPPLAWWLSAGIARLAGSEAAWVVRLPFIALFAVSTWLMYRLTALLFGAGAAWYAALALTLSPVFGFTTATWVLPDGPLDCALLAAALCLVGALPSARGWGWWLGAGLAGGCALLSKYSAGLVMGGCGIYLLTQPAHRAWLARPQPYLALLVALALLSPVLAWNAAHGWASFLFQGGRGAVEQVRPFGPLVVLGGGALFVLPWLWLPMMAAWLRALRGGPAIWQSWLACCLAAPPVLLFALVGLWSKHVLYHWATPGYLMMFPLLGALLERLAQWRPRLVHRTLAATAAALLLTLGVLATELRWNWLPLGADRFAPGADPEQQAVDWTALPAALSARDLLAPGVVVGAPGWQEAGKLSYALGPGIVVLCLNADAREFRFTAPPEAHQGSDVLIVAARAVTLATLDAGGFGFERLDALAPVSLGHPARPGQRLLVYLGHRLSLRAR